MHSLRIALVIWLIAASAVVPAGAFLISAESSCLGPGVYSYYFAESALVPDFTVKVSDSAILPDLTIKLVSSPRLADLVLVDSDLLGVVEPDMRICSTNSSLTGVSIRVSATAIVPDLTVKVSELAVFPDYALFVSSDRVTVEQAAALFAVIWEKNRRARSE